LLSVPAISFIVPSCHLTPSGASKKARNRPSYDRSVVNVEAFKAAARAAIVIPSVFAFASTVIGRPQVALFAAFGSFAMLVLVEFGGRRRARLAAYAGFAAAGAGLITLGTLCSRTSWLAAGAMAVVAFVILFSGGFSGYLAAAANGAMLLFVLPANLPAPNSSIPDRLLGWVLAAGVGTAAVVFLWPPRRRADLRHAAAGALRSAIELIEAEPSELTARSQAAHEASRRLTDRFLGSQHRPTGPTDATAALAALPDELGWLLSFLAPTGTEGAPRPRSGSDTEGEALRQAVAVLRASADRLDGGSATADFDGLDRAQHDLVVSLKERLSDLTWSDDRSALPPELVRAFKVRAAAAGARQLAVQAMAATAGNHPPDDHADAPAHPSLVAVEQVASEHATVRSVWLQNSLRGAVALAVAVFVAQSSGVQHSFWIVLGTLSVLRSNALGTGWSILTALAGTAAGIVVGAAIVVGIGTHHGALWAVLPLAILLASYAPRAISFAAGQAAFTVVLLILFNLIQPVGWRVGVVRIEDVAIGFAVSLGVGLLFWPRGASATLNSNLAEAYARGADYVAAALHELLGSAEPETARRFAGGLDASIHRLDDAFRQYLVERSATWTNAEDVAALVNGATRVRRVAQSLAALSATPDPTTLRRCGVHVDPEVDAMRAWFVAFGHTIADHGDVTAPHLRDGDGRRALFECARAAAAGDAPAKRASLTLLWAVEHLEVLRQLESHLAARANAVNAAGQPRAARLRFRLAS
jgi:uncharacterized membrane protein YccC